MHRRSLLFAAGAALLAKPRDLVALDAIMNRNMAASAVPGAVVGSVGDGSNAWIRPYGAVADGGAAVTADTVFQAASLTKQITAYAAFALRGQGKLDFSRTLASYVDDFAKDDARARRVTLRHVLSHSGGFPNWRFERGQSLTPAFEPGERFQYSGEGFVYLQRIIEHVTGGTFAEAVQKLVFDPLDMKSSALYWTPELDARFAQPHNGRGELRKDWNKTARSLHERAGARGLASYRYEDSIAAAQTPLPNWILPNAAASLVITATDYAKFVAAAIRNPELRTPLVTMRQGKDWSLGWGLGWGIQKADGREILWQWGDNGGYKNIVFAEPSRGKALFVFTNGDGGMKVYDRAIRHLTGRDHPALVWI
jgi:CubicO group peptidase (beta-lactamase class C family)